MLFDILISLGLSFALFLAGWLISLLVGRAVVVDVLWGLAGVALALLAYFMGEGAHLRRLLLLVLVAAWGVRLSVYLLFRVVQKGEDKRYKDMLEKSQKPFWLFSLVNVFILQSFILWFNLLPVTVAAEAPMPVGLTYLDYLGLLVWLTGFIFQTVGDWQLASFKAKAENQGKVLTTGLWRYTRHPNYFGEAVMWWGIYLIAAATFAGRWTILSPIMMTILLLRVSGVAMTERYMEEKGEEFRDYQRRTSAFFPLPPKE